MEADKQANMFHLKLKDYLRFVSLIGTLFDLLETEQVSQELTRLTEAFSDPLEVNQIYCS